MVFDIDWFELFFMIKVWYENLLCDKFIFSVCESFIKLKMDYVDLLLIYWLLFDEEVFMEEYIFELVEVKKFGFVWEIGIFNFIIE